MKRMGMVLKLKPGMKTAYLNAHKNVWPEVYEALRSANIQNNTAFVNNDLIFMYLEYSGDNFLEDWKSYGTRPKVQEWFSEIKKYVELYEVPPPPTIWSVLEEAFHLD